MLTKCFELLILHNGYFIVVIFKKDRVEKTGKMKLKHLIIDNSGLIKRILCLILKKSLILFSQKMFQFCIHFQSQTK